MKSLFERMKQAHVATMEKVKAVLHQRDDMRLQMEEALTAKEAVSPEADLHFCFCRSYTMFSWSIVDS